MLLPFRVPTGTSLPAMKHSISHVPELHTPSGGQEVPSVRLLHVVVLIPGLQN
jgi:hypothetical protein